MLSDPRISVVLPVYNAEKYLEKAIRSILEQTFSDFELIIVNDGSIDQSENIVLSIKDSRIYYVSNECNMGIVRSLNKGIALARGEYIARMDADDISDKRRFEKQLAFLEDNPDIGLCGSSLKVLGENRILRYSGSNEEIQFDFLTHNAIAHPVVMFRKSLLLKYGFSYQSEYFPAEDYYLWVKLGEVCQFYNLEEPLLEYRLHQESVSHSQRQNQMKKVNRIRAFYLLRSCNLWNTEDEFFIEKVFSGNVISNLEDIVRLNRIFRNCIINNVKFDPDKLKKYLNECYFQAFQTSDLSIVRLIVEYWRSDFFGGYRDIFRIMRSRVQKVL